MKTYDQSKCPFLQPFSTLLFLCTTAHSLCYSGTTQFADHLCVFEIKCFLKSVTSVMTLNAFYCEVVHLSTMEITCNNQAGILIRKWHNLEKCSGRATAVGTKLPERMSFDECTKILQLVQNLCFMLTLSSVHFLSVIHTSRLSVT